MERNEHNEYDVIVVGYGDAGAAAAIEAADAGGRVLVLDRSYGGGASALSGGVVYAGGGTRYQKEAGYDDTPENLFNYLAQEVGDAVDEPTLRRFCEQSPRIIPWLEEQGARFKSGVPPYKTSYPTDDFYLYYSGNEKAYPYDQHAVPAPRGHRTLAKGMSSGKVLFDALSQSAKRKGVTFIPLARVERVIVEEGKVVGVNYRALPLSHPQAKRHRSLIKRSGKVGNWFPALGKRSTDQAEAIWNSGARPQEARAHAVILSAGGFIYNPAWVEKYAPEFTDINPLGTPGDDGSGIQLGLDVGGTVSHMNNVTAWRFLSPPSAWLEGVTVGMNGTRIMNEDLYGATHGNVMMREHAGLGWAVFDSAIWKKARGQLRTQTQMFQVLQAVAQYTIGRKKGRTLDQLAAKIGVDRGALHATVTAYNRGVQSGEGDPAHKAAEYSTPVVQAPFYAIDISAKNAFYFPIPGLTLGGLVVDGESGLVVREDGSPIDGLYAAGRNAVGICSNSYISGLSLADCLFSGRRAGAHAAALVAGAAAGPAAS